MKYFLLLLLTACAFQTNAQQVHSQHAADTVPLLTEIVIKGFESDRRLLETPVSAGIVSYSEMQRFSNGSLLPALNMIPGVRMEERSPGSYRLSIRGSLLRSPYGVRNIKVYWNDIPFSDAGGNTYFNLVDQHSLGQIEILKGPGGSMYGANTGGVIILHPDALPFQSENNRADHQFRARVTGGSYGLLDEHVQWKYQNKNFVSTFTQSHLQSDGYRENARLRRDVLQWNGSARISGKDELDWILMYADMFYQTPGGLNLKQMEENPRQARPGTNFTPGAVAQKAAIYNKTPFAGISNRHQFNKNWSNVTSVMLNYSNFKNPFITNFEIRKETNLGLRTKLVYQTIAGRHHLKFTGGTEWLYNFSTVDNFGNRGGQPDTVQFSDKIQARQIAPFLQGEWQMGENFQLQAGLGSNFFVYHYQRLTDADNRKKRKQLDEQLLPRFAALYRITKNLSLYASVSKGFSPPSVAEVRPSEGSFYTNLQPEYGWNREIGIRGSAFNHRLLFDVTAYRFKLQDAIVRRMDNADAEFFVNAGGTDQKGIEAYAEFALIQAENSGFISSLKLRGNLTLNDFSFTNYIVDDKDYSGKALTGVAKTIWQSGFDVNTRLGLYLLGSFTHTAKLPLNDGNTDFAPAFNTLLARLGWRHDFSRVALDIFTGVDNALNEQYSLGNDINAFGKRYYNPAPGRNFYGGLMIRF